MEFEATQFDDSLLDPAPEEQDTPVVDESVAQMGAQEDGHDDFDNQYNNYYNQNQNQDGIELNAYEQFLKSKGVRDGRTIVYEDEETGETSEVNFTDLSTEEQFNILNEISRPDLSDDEINTINFLRQNNVTMQDVIGYYQEQAVQEYIKNSGIPTQHYSSDDYNDDEIYIADLKLRYPDMSDEELLEELHAAKENEELFAKKASVIRNNYKHAEETRKQEYEEQHKREQEQYIAQFNAVLDQFNYIPMDYKDPNGGAFQVENSEKAAIWDYLFKQDVNGTTAFARDLNDPSRVIEMAHRMLFGAEAMSDLTRHFKQELKKVRRSSDTQKSASTTTVVKNSAKQKAKSEFDDENSTSLNPGWGSLL